CYAVAFQLYALSLHYALPLFRHRGGLAVFAIGHIFPGAKGGPVAEMIPGAAGVHEDAVKTPGFRSGFHGVSQMPFARHVGAVTRSEEHTSELQSRENLACRLL